MSCCRDCKYLGEQITEFRYEDGYLVDMNSPSEYYECLGISDTNNNVSMAYTYDGEGYMSGIRVRLNFGCNLFSPKIK